MKVVCKELSQILEEALPGTSPSPVLEQSDCFVLVGKEVRTFNDAISVRAKLPPGFGLDAILRAADVLSVLGKFPDKELEVVERSTEVVFKGKRRSAGVSKAADKLLPLDAVPSPGKWRPFPEDARTALLEAAYVCSKEDVNYLQTVVHVSPTCVEACDNFRLLRFEGTTGFSGDVLIPAVQIHALSKFELAHVSIGEGWVFFKNKRGSIFSVRCGHMEYREGLDEVLKMDEAEVVRLPSNLPEILDRASIMSETGEDFAVGVVISDGEIAVTSRKEGGWFKERKKILYKGRPLAFDANPKLLSDVLKRARTVEVSRSKLKVSTGHTQFVVSLQELSEQEEE